MFEEIGSFGGGIRLRIMAIAGTFALAATLATMIALVAAGAPVDPAETFVAIEVPGETQINTGTTKARRPPSPPQIAETSSTGVAGVSPERNVAAPQETARTRKPAAKRPRPSPSPPASPAHPAAPAASAPAQALDTPGKSEKACEKGNASFCP